MDQKLIEKLIRPEIRDMQAYQVQTSAGMVKLDSMENPYIFSDKLRDQWLEKVKLVDFNRYPDPAASQVKAKLVKQLQLKVPQNLMFGNGSDELIQIVIQALASEAGPIMSVSPTFVMYSVSSTITGKQYVDIPLNPDFSLDCDAVLNAISKFNPSCVFLAYPNNPTGNLFVQEDVEKIIESTSGLVIVDEAYLPFAGRTFIDRLDKYENLLIMRTMSKVGMAGLRFGMLIGHQNWIEQFEKIRPPYNINSLTQASVEFSLENIDFFEDSAEKIVEERARIYYQLLQLKGLEVFPSDANFILFKSTDVPATQVFEGLLERHILIKCLHKPDTILEQCLRVTIGTQRENNSFLESIRQIIRG